MFLTKSFIKYLLVKLLSFYIDSLGLFIIAKQVKAFC